MSLAKAAFDTPELLPKVLIPVSAVLAILFAIVLTTRTARIKVKHSSGSSVRTENGREYLLSVRLHYGVASLRPLEVTWRDALG